MKKLVLGSLLLSSLAIAQAYYTILPYAGLINYSGTTTKDKGDVEGLYLSVYELPWKTELDVEHTRAEYNDSTTDLRQDDFTVIFNYYDCNNIAYKLGFHHISSTDSLTDNGNIFMGGILYYERLKYNYGFDIYYSEYSNNINSPKVLQVTPKFGLNFGDYYSPLGSFYIEGKVDYISILEKQKQNGLDSSYTSTQFDFHNYNGRFTSTIGAWFGNRVFEVGNGGFIVNNLTNKQTGGFKFSENFKIDTFSSIKFEYNYLKFDDNGKSFSRTYLLNYLYSF